MSSPREESDSLFEGMILFNPSEIPQLDHNHHPPRPNGDAPTASSPPHAPQPLDENLFSDLTLVTPAQTLAASLPQLDAPDPSPTTTTTTRGGDVPAASRQISRKKRRPGLRIGYGRDSPAAADPLPLSELDAPSVNFDQPHSSSSAAREEISDARHPSSDPHSDSCSLSSPPPVLAPPAESLGDASSKREDSSQDSTCTDRGLLQNHEEVSDAVDFEQQPEEEVRRTSASSGVEFEQIKARVSEKLEHARGSAASVSAKRKDCTRRRRKAADAFNSASLKYRELEMKLEEACEAEDFEMAESLSESLAAAEEEKQGLLNSLREAEAHSDVIDSDMQEVLKCQIAAEEECASLLEHFARDAAGNANSVSEEAEVVSSQEMDKWLSSSEALEVKKMELEVEQHLVNETRLVLNDSIEHSIEGDRREREFFCKKKEILTDELNKLLALVKEKEKEIAENDSNIQAVEERIFDVVSGFQEMRSNIDVKYDTLQSGMSQIELESVSLLKKRNEIDDFLSQQKERSMKLKELARISADEAKEYQEVVELRRCLLSSILKSREDKVRLVKSEEKLSLEVQMLRQGALAERASLQELSSTKSSVQQEIASIKQRIFFIDKRVPELEAEKKAAATTRNFKEAARISAEAKTLCIEKEGMLSKMEGATSELVKLEENMKGTVERLQKTEKLISSKEKEVAVARFQRLRLVTGAALAERSAALELGDLEEANLLLAEVEAAKSEAKKLQMDCNFEEELANLSQLFFSLELVSNLGKKQLAELTSNIR